MTKTHRRGNTPQPPRRSDRTPWAWLLLVPLLVTLYPPLYNRRTPELFGVPFFYWYQLAAVLVGVACTYTVYRATRYRPPTPATPATPATPETPTTGER